MASSDKDASCANDPDFAVICAFLEKFSEQLLVHYPDFKQLEDWITNTDEVPNGLRDLHIKLMRKTRRTVHECAWETALSKFCFSYSSQDGWEIERFGYKKSSLKVKLRILRELLESQFDRNNKFRAKLLTMSPESLRSQPIGHDRLGHSYWLTQDLDCNLRIYQEHLDEEIWQVVATNREELVKLISRLRGNEVVLPSEIGVVDEDSSSNSCSAPIVKPPPPEEKDDSQESNQSTGRIPNIKIKLDDKENGVVLNTASNEVIAFEKTSVEDCAEKEEEKKVKPLVISHSKILEKLKKRPLDEHEKSEPEEIKKQRPSLLDSKREKKLSKYEKAKQEDDDEDDGDDDEDDEEGEEEDEVEDEDDDGEEGDEAEDGEEDEDEEDVGEEEAEVEPDAERKVETVDDPGEEEGDDNDENIDQVEKVAGKQKVASLILSEAIEDPPVIVKNDGSGAECESNIYDFLLSRAELVHEPEFGEVIEEKILHIVGEGAGLECLGGNVESNETEPEVSFFFDQPGSLKLSPEENHDNREENELCNKMAVSVDHHANDVEVVDTCNPVINQQAVTTVSKKEKKPSRRSTINRNLRLSDKKSDKVLRHSAKKLKKQQSDMTSPSNLKEQINPFPQEPSKRHGSLAETGAELQQPRRTKVKKEASQEVTKTKIKTPVSVRKNKSALKNEVVDEQKIEAAIKPIKTTPKPAKTPRRQQQSAKKQNASGKRRKDNDDVNLETDSKQMRQSPTTCEINTIREVGRRSMGRKSQLKHKTKAASKQPNEDNDVHYISDLENESLAVDLIDARTARKIGVPCQKCEKSENLEWMLLCDKCLKGYHCSCLSPLIFHIPESDWFCPPCQHEKLIAALENHLETFDDLVQRKKEEKEERLEQGRLKILYKTARARKDITYPRKLLYDESEDTKLGTDASNLSKSESAKSSSSDSETDSDDERIYKFRKRRQINVSYRFDEYDDMTEGSSGAERERSYNDFVLLRDEPEPEFSEVIEEATLHVVGEGVGVECLVGNAKSSEAEPKATFFFGQPGCLKLSPVKNQTKSEDNQLCNDDERQEELSKNVPEPANGENHLGDVGKTLEEAVEEKTPPSEKSEPNNGSQEDSKLSRQSNVNRKRRLSDAMPEKVSRHSSESETELNSEVLEDQMPEKEEEQDIGGKRPKMRNKQLMNTEIRKKVETQRKIKEATSSSGEEEKPCKKLPPKMVENEVRKILPLKAKLKRAAVEALRTQKEQEAKVKNEVEPELPAPVSKLITSPIPTNASKDEKIPKKQYDDVSPPPTKSLGKDTKNPDDQEQKKKPVAVEIKTKKQSPEPTSRLGPNEKPDETLVENEKSAKAKADDQTTPENQRKRHSSEEDSRVSEAPIPKLVTPPSVTKTRTGRRGGPPEPVAELPQLKRTRVKAKVEKEVPQEPAEIAKNKTKTLHLINKSSLKKEAVDEQKMEIKEDTTAEEISAEEAKPATEISVKKELKIEEETKSTKTTPKPVPTTRPQQQAAQKQPASGQRRKNHDDVDTKNIIDTEADTTPVRQSRRIAQLKIREEADRRKMEEVALRNMKAELKKKKKAEMADDPTVSEPSEHSSDHADSEVEIKKKAEKKKKCPGKGGWSSGSEEPEEEEEEQYETDPGSPLFRSDHEFSPESEMEDESQIVPLKRARTARKEGEEVVQTAAVDESCQKCGKSDHPEWILLCDKCDKGYHCSCLSPVIFYIPEGDWCCPLCQQEELIVALENYLKEFDNLVQRKKEEEEERVRTVERERLELEKVTQANIEKKNKRKQIRSKKRGSRKNSTSRRKLQSDEDDDSDDNATGTDASNSSKSSSSRSRSSKTGTDSTTDSDDEPIYKLRKRRQINVSYRLNEYDDMIKSALKEEEDEVAGAGNLGRGKDISTIIEADKEEKLRQQQQRIAEENGDAPDGVEKTQESNAAAVEDSGSDFEPMKRKPKVGRHIKKKSRKLTKLDVSSEGDDSDEDFKTSSMDDEEEDDEEDDDGSQSSDSSLEEYRRRRQRGGKKKTRRAARRAARERRKDRRFIVDDSDGSEEHKKHRSKKKRKKDSDYTESETNDDDELSENIDSDDLCDDSTESGVSDGAWRPSKRNKQNSNAIARKSPKLKTKSAPKLKKTKRVDDNNRSFKAGISKTRMIRDDSDDGSDDSVDSSRKTRGKRCTYLEDYDDDSSDGGIKPGVKRPDTPPEEREKFIKKQEEIKRMLAEKNAEGAKLAATPRLIPIKAGAQKYPLKLDSLSTVPLSVIRQAKVLDIDYLQRKGESISEGDLDESEFDDDDLPDDFNPEDMDEEAIARMVEEEDFAQQQLKLPPPGEVLRKRTSKDSESILRPMTSAVPQSLIQCTSSSASGLQEPVRKKLPMPTMHPPLLRHGYGLTSQHMLQQSRSSAQQSHLPLLQNALSGPLNHPRNFPPTTQAIPATTAGMGPSHSPGADPTKPRGRRKKITPLRDPLQKQQAAAAASAAAAAAKPRGDNQGKLDVAKPPPSAAVATPGVIKSALSIAQPPQLYKPPPANTQPSVITRMPHLQGRQPMIPQVGGPPFCEQGSRFYGPPPQSQHQQQLPAQQGQPPPNALLPPSSRPPMRHRGPPMPQMPPHHTQRPSYVGGPPPLRPSTSRPPISLSNDIQGPPRALYSGSNQQFGPPPARHSAPPHLSPYRPQMFGNPGFGQRGPPPNSSQPSVMRPPGTPSEYTSPGSYVGGYGYYPPPPLPIPHSAPPPPTASAVPSSVIVSASSLAAATSVLAAAPPPPQAIAAVSSRPPASSPSLIEKSCAPVSTRLSAPSVIELSRKKLTTLETFNTKTATAPPPLIESSESRSPYSSNPPTVGGIDEAPDDGNSGSPRPSSQSTSEFSGLVSYFSSQHDDFNT